VCKWDLFASETMLLPEVLANADALAKLAKLNPLSEAAVESATASSSDRKGSRRTIASSGGKVKEGAERIGGAFTVSADPAWLKAREAKLASIIASSAAKAAGASEPITVTLPDGKKIDGKAFETSPLDIATGISKGLAQACCVASVKYTRRLHNPAEAELITVAADPDGDDAGAPADAAFELWDLARPLEGDCDLKLHKFDSEEGQQVFWHSSAHILGESLETLYGARLTHGPPTGSGFFYDSYMGSTAVTTDMQSALEKQAKKVADAKQPFERVVVTKEECLDLFESNPFKTAMISSKLPEGSSTTVYKCGPFVDLCKGPHLPNTSRVKAFKVAKASSSLWLGKVGNDELQRVYGVAFGDKKELKEWEEIQKAAAERDHRVIGVQQELLFFDDLSPGSCFFLPHGTRIYNRLCDMIRKEYFARNYQEVVTPNMYNLKLWETSGHAAKYKENMFLIDIEGQEFGLKPMNCPGHCIMFKHRKRSYRELPLRMADFGVLHRNELSGALTGLTRVRRFQQDDAHIFCTVGQIKSEVAGVLDMISTVYRYFGMTFALKLSTKPESALGDPATWEKAEQMMAEALDEFKEATGHGWTLNPGDGAFYGPKIDVQVFDALKRPFQCATVQLDFVQPMRFDLKYQAKPEEGADEKSAAEERPVMVHRAVLGSVERMIAILIEHYAGKWPFFLSPRQAMVVPVSKAFEGYAQKVQQEVRAAGFFVDVDLSHRTLNKMVRESQLSQYNYILVVGGDEEKNGTVNVRTRDNTVQGTKTISELIGEFGSMMDDKTLDLELGVAKKVEAKS